jgi:hypothetical protein
LEGYKQFFSKINIPVLYATSAEERESGRATSAAQQREGESGCDVGNERRVERESVERERVEK